MFGWGKSKPAHNFRQDSSLHNEEPVTKKFGIQDVAPAVRLAVTKTFHKNQMAGVVKDMVPTLDIDDVLSKKMTQGMITMLWGSLLHPPLSYKGPEHQYRSADGSMNNVMFPHLGQAGSAYAKSIQPKQPFLGARPDPGDLFDLLMARQTPMEANLGVSSLLLYNATIIIHDIFRTSDEDVNLSKTSSYLDLAPLYGSSVEERDRIRTKKNGMLKPDTFCEDRLLDQPPGVCIFIIMYNRFHNYVAEQLLAINENGKFSLPLKFQHLKDTPKDDRKFDSEIEQKMFEAALIKQDDDLFETARLVTCGMYIQIAIQDYLRVLMLMHEHDTPWTLDPRTAYPDTNDSRGLQRGEGNMVSAEFSLLYRFHSPLSARDADWSEELFIELLKMPPRGADPSTYKYVYEDTDHVTEEEITTGQKITRERIKQGDTPVPKFQATLRSLKGFINSPKYAAAKNGPCFPPGLDRVGASGGFRFKRDPKTLRFDDAQLAAEMYRVIEDPICNFGARNTPKVFKQLEVLGILQMRKWELASLNEFREFFGIPKHKTFEDMNSDPAIQDALRYLYEDPDQVELYPGIFCEGLGRDLNPPGKLPSGDPSALWRGIFSDAVTLVRSDRFYTLDWNVQSLTSWGMDQVDSNPRINKGSVFHRLFDRAFPGYFKYNSLHMWQPFYTPTKNARLAQAQGYIDQFDLSDLEWAVKGEDGWTMESAGDCNFKSGNVSKKLDFLELAKLDARGCPTRMIRKKLIRKEGVELKWRGGELAIREPKPLVVSDYFDIREKILTGPTEHEWTNPSTLDSGDVPAGPLRDILTGKFTGWKKCTKLLMKILKQHGQSTKTDKFLAYFQGMSADIRRREARPMQYLPGNAPWTPGRERKPGTTAEEEKLKVKRIDIVKDYAIPIVTRFVADFLGFWKRVKTDLTDEARGREFDENDIYALIQDYQNYYTYNKDPTKGWERRKAFQQSIRTLKELTEQGVAGMERGMLEGLWGRTYGDSEEMKRQPYVIDIRKMAIDMVQELVNAGYNRDHIVAIMLVTALDASYKVVLTFTETLAYFVDPKMPSKSDDDREARVNMWEDLQNAAFQNTPEGDAKIKKYILEGQRLTHVLDLTRVYTPKGQADSSIKAMNAEGEMVEVKPGDHVAIDLATAARDPKAFKNPEKLDITRTEAYLVYGNDVDSNDPEKQPTFSKYLSLIAMTGMLKHIATTKNLRVGHDLTGLLKKVRTPEGEIRYCSPRWDVLVSAPSTWTLRFDGIGKGVFKGTDNSDVGHSIDETWHLDKYLQDKLGLPATTISAVTDAVKAENHVVNGDVSYGKDQHKAENGVRDATY